MNHDHVVSLSPLTRDHAEGFLEANDGGGDGSGPSVVFGGGLSNPNDGQAGGASSRRIVISKKRK